MKKRLKKLTLGRETLRNLSDRDARAALGAATGDTSCRCKEQTGCGCGTETVTRYPACYSLGCSG